MRRFRGFSRLSTSRGMHLAWIAGAVVFATVAALAAPMVPPAVEMPGTQPLEVGGFTPVSECMICHGGTTNPDLEPFFGWQGGMMAHAGRDPLFWAALAITEQDFLPDADPALRGGAGDFCLRCHFPQGWLQGRSTPTDGSGFSETLDADGVECEFCHKLVDPDPPVNVVGTTEIQNVPYIANDGANAYFGSGMFVVSNTPARLGPYDDPQATHDWAQSTFQRSGDLCGTCHDVSNPVVGDLAHNGGTQDTAPPVVASGDPSSDVEDKAAFNNHPHSYGIAERTYSEWRASGLDDYLVNDFLSLPADLKTAGGSIEVSRRRAYQPFQNTANYADGTTRYYTCQTCHMSAGRGVGCKLGGTPTRFDLARHDQTGSGYWMPDLIQYMDTRGTLVFGDGLTATQTTAMDAGRLRAEEILRSAALLEANNQSGTVVVRVTNLTGHKLITGYPEGRRMWLNVRWFDNLDTLVHEDGVYGPIGRSVADLDSVFSPVHSLLDPDNTVIFEAHPGMDQEWADQLLGLGYDSGMSLTYDRITDSVTKTLGQLAADPPGTKLSTFHFALNNVVLEDTRIPPYRLDRDEATERNALPVPDTQYGNPAPGGVYDYWSNSVFYVPSGAVRAEVRLFYQQTSWEYIQFLWLENDGLGSFLGQEGINLLDGWLNTGQNAPLELNLAHVDLAQGGIIAPGEAAQISTGYDDQTGTIDITFQPACDATDHTIYWGPLDQVSAYDYQGALCHAGNTGQASFDPGQGSVFFLVVGNNGWAEGSYGRDSDQQQRAEGVGTPGCDLVQDLSGTCDP